MKKERVERRTEIERRNNLSTLITTGKVVTTLSKAKQLQPIAEKLITLCKYNSPGGRHEIAKELGDDCIASKLIDELAPQYGEEVCGYTRITTLRQSSHRSKPLVVLQFSPMEPPTPPKRPPAPPASPETSSEPPTEPENATT